MSRLHAGWVAAAALGAALAGCSGNASPQTMPVAAWGEQGSESVSGAVRQVGNLPFARTLVDDDGDGVFVTGDLENEITRLAGMTIRVTGSFTDGEQPGRYILATSYELLSGEEGDPMAVGILSRDEEGFYLRLFDGAEYRLSQVPPELEDATGAKLWVAAAEGEHVRGYGILRESTE